MRLFKTTLTRITAALCLALLVCLPQAGSAQTAYPGFYRIVLPDAVEFPAQYQRCIAAAKADGSDPKICEPGGLHNENGKLELGRIQPNWWSAQWEILDAGSGQFNIRNRYTGEFLAATFNPSVKAIDRWNVQLVKPDTVITTFNAATGALQTRPVSDLQEATVWHIVKAPDGHVAIFNSAIKGLAKSATGGRTGSLVPVSPGTQAPMAMVAESSFLGINGSIDTGAAIGTKVGALFRASDAGEDNMMVPSASWILESTGEVIIPKDVDIVRIVTGGTLALNIETGTPAVGEVAPGWLSAQWVEQAVDGGGGPPLTLFRNVWTSKYLAMQGGVLTMMDRDPAQESQGLSRLPYAWRVTGGNGPGGFARAIQNGATNLYLALDKAAFVGTAGAAQYIWAMDNAREAPPPPPPAPDVLVRLELGTEAVNVETGPVKFGATPPNFWSGDWIYEERTGGQRQRLVSLRNRWKNQYLLIRNGAVIMADPVNPEVINDPSQMEELWHSVGVNDQGLILRHLRTGLYLGQPSKDNLTVSPTPTTIDKTPWRIRELR